MLGTGANCLESPSQELLTAVQQFNGGEWFDCHETLEDLWVGSKGEMRDLYQGLLMIAVALHHWREGNFEGSVVLLDKGTAHLRRVPPVCQGVAVEPAVAQAIRFRDTLVALGPEKMAEMDHLLIPRVQVAPG